MRRCLIAAIAASLLVATPASADPGRVTKGDVRAHFQTSHSADARPNTLFEGGIRPFPFSPWDGGHFCVDDWHVLVLAVWIPEEFLAETNKGIRDQLDATSVDLILDGDTISDTERTAFKPLFVDEGKKSNFYYETGAFYEPGALTVGLHTFKAVFHVPGFDFEFGPIEFTIDDSNGPACN